MFKYLEKYLMEPMTKISQIRLIRAITAAGMASIPFTIVGSMFLVLTILPLTMPFLQGIWDATFLKVSNVYMLANKASMGIISLYFLLVISYEYTKSIKIEEDIDVNPITGMLLSVFAFFMFIPQFVNESGFNLLSDPEKGVINGWAIGGDGVVRLSAIGIFTAILTVFIAVNVYKLCIKKHIVIKMPKEVPSGVANSFTALIPAFFISIIVFLIQGILVSLGTDLFGIVSIPFGFVTNIVNTYWGMLLIMFLIHALWIVGIHGASIILSMITPIVLLNLQANVAGSNIVFAGDFGNALAYFGGSGSTLGLVLLCIFLAKSEQLKAIGKASLIPGIFQINEPVIFGMPIVYNPILVIPFLLAPMVGSTIGYLAISTGLINKIIAQHPWPSPIGVGAFIATGGDFKAVLAAIVSFLASTIIYYPFFKLYDKKLLREQELNK
ncbi:PTS cellobiose transporter subunit IIC [Helcococcus ovis]|uniref:Permease IIC component n=1 Tax=Helcococcus ovis TaxID=72026 RepID=A0A4R9BZV2_9FIRM|nr:PTS cellobiose transporter subunit IIC [Helcococcus ovis]TFF64046.1 PTS cellobiose transporter subunit IIC [Helcococcus ovis]TFF64638.1 PTS cellobiose transporter subunit IIC [Helcococcus ovis]